MSPDRGWTREVQEFQAEGIAHEFGRTPPKERVDALGSKVVFRGRVVHGRSHFDPDLPTLGRLDRSRVEPVHASDGTVARPVQVSATERVSSRKLSMAEFMRFEGDLIAEIEVYFGRELP